ncbi:hypothetical protein FGRMN_2375 [Fusarium graminum]|nr:hypothetical protein FGRMN_2375 [Fusarium graminum]
MKQNDIDFLERYFAIRPWAFHIPKNEIGYQELYIDLELVIQSGSLGTLRMLLDYATRGVDIIQPMRFKRFGFQLLNEAARWSRIEMVQFCLDHQPLYADIRDRDKRGYSAIMAAADIYTNRGCFSPEWDQVSVEDSQTIMNLLLDHGARASDFVLSIHDEDTMTETVLSLAAKWAGTELTTRLIDEGPDLHVIVRKDPHRLGFWNAREYHGAVRVTVLFVACIHANPQAVKVLIDRHGSLPIHYAIRNQIPELPNLLPTPTIQEIARNISGTIDILLDLAPDTINTKDDHENTPLH